MVVTEVVDVVVGVPCGIVGVVAAVERRQVNCHLRDNPPGVVQVLDLC